MLTPGAGSPRSIFYSILNEICRAGVILILMLPALAGGTSSWLCQPGFCFSLSPPTQPGIAHLRALGNGSELPARGPETIKGASVGFFTSVVTTLQSL